MSGCEIYHAGMRELQDRFGTRLLADRLAQHTRRETFTPDDQTFIEGRTFFLLATTDDSGFPDCSYKGGAPGYVRITGPNTLAFPSLDGNGMFRSLGNIAINPKVGLLFIDFDQPKRLRVNGHATIVFDDPMMAEFPGADLMVHLTADSIFPNCPRYIHQGAGLSPYLDRSDGQTKVPAWKGFPQFADALPKREPKDGREV